MKTEIIYKILPYVVDDVEDVQKMWAQSWRETYPSEEHGVSKKWVEQRLAEKLSPEGIERRREQVVTQQGNPDIFFKIAKDKTGKVVGMIMGERKDGKDHLNALYTASETHGTGLAQAMMRQFFEWASKDTPISTTVASYNKRARKFYEKMGFSEIPGSEHLFDDKIPSVILVKNHK